MERIRVSGMILDDTATTRAKYVGQLAEKIATKRLAIQAMRLHYRTDYSARIDDRDRVIKKLETDLAELQKLLDDARGDHDARS